MAKITLHGNVFSTVGELPAVGSCAPGFALAKGDLSDAKLQDYSGKTLVLNIFPSVDTPVCANSVRRFNQDAAKCSGAAVLCISMDLPFALGRFCGAEGVKNVESLSAFRSPEFGKSYGVAVADGPLRGLLSRAVVIIDSKGKVAYTEQVPEIAQEPEYEKALEALRKAQ